MGTQPTLSQTPHMCKYALSIVACEYDRTRSARQRPVNRWSMEKRTWGFERGDFPARLFIPKGLAQRS